MTQYTVVISAAGDQMETVVSVETVAGAPRVTEVAVRSRDGRDMALGQLPAIDLRMLVHALWPSGRVVESDAVESQVVAVDAGVVDAPASGAGPVKTVPVRTDGGRKPAAAGRATTAPTPGKSTVRAGRIYRKMPNDLAEVYAEQGTIVGVAKHYGVPRHTAQGWVGRLRSSAR
ncbi:hypothetical protein ACN27F_23300 [Solwaraspora sp. WMMB335]|uniref:hypothetical protein n=1 Tax=Solwaraspora sp. WMMB335 TaxID=3404118 RepID=UPI003B929C3F